jgi:hypothetical protein
MLDARNGKGKLDNRNLTCVGANSCRREGYVGVVVTCDHR